MDATTNAVPDVARPPWCESPTTCTTWADCIASCPPLDRTGPDGAPMPDDATTARVWTDAMVGARSAYAMTDHTRTDWVHYVATADAIRRERDRSRVRDRRRRNGHDD